MTLADICTIVIAIATCCSVIYFAQQASATRQQSKGQFLLALDDHFEKANAITARLVGEPDFKPVDSEWADVWRLMAIFERVNIMVEDKILDIGIVDRLHGFRLQYIIANEAIYERLEATGAEWQDFIDLCYAVADYRVRKYKDPRDTAFAERVHKLNKRSSRLVNPWSYQ